MLTIIIVNFRTPDLTIDCLASLQAELSALPEARVIVVDNASGDASAERIQTAIESRGWANFVSLSASDQNLGFAGGNNFAIREVLKLPQPPEFIMLLNPDTIVRSGGVRSLLEFLKARPNVGIVGSQLENASGELERSAHRLPTPWSELDSGAKLGMLSRWLARYNTCLPIDNQAQNCHWVSGASMLIRREVFEQIGLLDDGYFLYFEEVDFCARARAAGWECWHVPDSRVLHLEGSATAIQQKRKRRGQYWYNARRRFFVKMYGLPGLIAADLLWAIGRTTLLLRKCLGLGGPQNGDPKWFALDLLWGDLRALLRGDAWRIKRMARKQ